MVFIFLNFNNTLKARLLSDLFSILILTATMPFMALYLSDIISPFFSGVFLTVSTVLNVLASFIGGYISDNKNKSTIIVYTQIILAVLMLIMAFSIFYTEYIIVFCVSYLLFNLFHGAQYPVLEATLMNAIENNEKEVYRIKYWFNNVATAIGALSGGIFYHWKPHILFLVGFFIFILVAFLYKKWIVTKDTELETSELKVGNMVRNYTKVLKNTSYIALILGYSFILVGEFSLSSFISVKLNEHFNNIILFNINIDGVLMFSILMLINASIVIMFTGVLGKIFTNFTNVNQLYIGLNLYIMGYVTISLSNDFSILIIAIVIATIGEIVYAPIFNVIKFKIIPEDNRGSYLAMSSVGFHMAQIFSRLLLVLYVYLSHLQMGLTLFSILTLGAFLIIFSSRKQK